MQMCSHVIHVVACRSLTGAVLQQALHASPDLHTLDVQHIPLPPETVQHLKQGLPLLKSVLHAQRLQ